jgi:hypothetical protein
VKIQIFPGPPSKARWFALCQVRKVGSSQSALCAQTSQIHSNRPPTSLACPSLSRPRPMGHRLGGLQPATNPWFIILCLLAHILWHFQSEQPAQQQQHYSKVPPPRSLPLQSSEQFPSLGGNQSKPSSSSSSVLGQQRHNSATIWGQKSTKELVNPQSV